MFRTPITRIGLVLCLAASTAASAQTASTAYTGPVAVVVSIAVPAGLPRAKVEALFQQQAPGFKALPGLKQKYFTVTDDGRRAGGIYLWTDAAAARAFFTDAWKAQVTAAYGSPAEISWFDAPLVIQGPAGMP